MKPGGPALWGDPFKRAVHTHVNQGYTKLVGVFHAEYGVLNRGTVVRLFYEITKYTVDLLLSSLGQFVSVLIIECILLFIAKLLVFL